MLDWASCPAVERDPEKVGGAWVFRDTRVPVVALFDAYNRCDIDKVGTFFSEDLEFYHEKGGLNVGRDATLAVMRKNLCSGDGYHVRRELVTASMEVRPIKDYGAVQTGEHRFYLTQKGRKEALDGICKFVMLWRKTEGGWKVSRVVSYGCRAPE